LLVTTPASAASAYANLARLTGVGSDVTRLGAEKSGGPDFGSLVKQAMSAVVESGHKADKQTQAAASGKADIIDVVSAVAETEVAIEALVSVRDRVIRSYEDILKMPI
jgi:flagellar hook-basal body complex protein FliE